MLFRGHTSYVNCALLLRDGSSMLSGSSDGTVKLWDVKTTECVSTFRPGYSVSATLHDLTVHTIVALPNTDHVLICRREPHAHICTAQGQVSVMLFVFVMMKSLRVECLFFCDVCVFVCAHG